MVALDLFHDLRAKASRKHVYGERPWTETYGICLHQTACVLGEKPERMLTVGAHVVISRAGRVFWLHDFTSVVAHGNGWNAKCVGIELDGLYAGVEGNPATVWDDPSTPQREQALSPTFELVQTAQHVIWWICATVMSQGGKVRSLVAHRQSSRNRRNDPGSALWQRVALPMMDQLGLSDGGPGFAIGTGLPIPESWDPFRKGWRY